MARRILFINSGFWKYSWAHLVMSMTESCRWVMQCRLRAQRPRTSNKGLWPCSLHQCFPTLFLEAHQHCTCWMSPLSDLYISGPEASTNKLMSWFSSGWLGKVGKCVVLVWKAFGIWCWGMLFLKYSTIYLHTLSQIGEPLPIFTSETLPLSKISLL